MIFRFTKSKIEEISAAASRLMSDFLVSLASTFCRRASSFACIVVLIMHALDDSEVTYIYVFIVTRVSYYTMHTLLLLTAKHKLTVQASSGLCYRCIHLSGFVTLVCMFVPSPALALLRHPPSSSGAVFPASPDDPTFIARGIISTL